jgi:hypothetical protein
VGALESLAAQTDQSRRQPLRMALAAAALFVASSTVAAGGLFRSGHYVDVPLYGRYVDGLVSGNLPYRDLFVGYPPGAFVALLPGAVLGQSHYLFVFKLLTAAVGALAVLLVARTLGALDATRRRMAAALGFLAISPLLLGSVWPNSYDAWPAALTIAALLALLRGRSALGLAALGLATAMKVYPGALLPLAVVWVWRGSGARAAATGAAAFAAAAATLPFFVLSPSGVWETFRAQAERGLHIESLGSSLLLVADRLGVYQATISRGSTIVPTRDLAGPLPDALAVATSVLALIAIIAVWLTFAAGETSGERLVLGFAACVMGLIAFNKVLSPQYGVWALFLVPVAAGRAGARACVLLGAALGLAQLWFHHYGEILSISSLVWLVLARDLALVAAFAILMHALWPRERLFKIE